MCAGVKKQKVCPTFILFEHVVLRILVSVPAFFLKKMEKMQENLQEYHPNLEIQVHQLDPKIQENKMI